MTNEQLEALDLACSALAARIERNEAQRAYDYNEAEWLAITAELEADREALVVLRALIDDNCL